MVRQAMDSRKSSHTDETQSDGRQHIRPLPAFGRLFHEECEDKQERHHQQRNRSERLNCFSPSLERPVKESCHCIHQRRKQDIDVSRSMHKSLSVTASPGLREQGSHVVPGPQKCCKCQSSQVQMNSSHKSGEVSCSCSALRMYSMYRSTE